MPASRPTPAALRALHPGMGVLVERYGLPPAHRRVPAPERFAALARSIAYQQLAGRAATVIHGRFVDAVGGDVRAEAVLAASPEQLAAAGLSRAKSSAIVDLASKVVSGEVQLERIGRLGDEEIIDHLVAVRGIGRWTAQMFLLGTLGRPDVWPTGDYGVRAGFALAFGHHELPAPKELEALGEPFRPHRSAVAWYCWRAVDAKAELTPGMEASA